MANKEAYFSTFISALTVVGMVGGTIIGTNISHNIANKDDLKKIISDASMIENNNLSELKEYFNAGSHKIGFTYVTPESSIEEPEIIIPEGYEVVSKKVSRIKINGNKYNQTKIVCINNVDVIAYGIYDVEDNEIRFLEPGTPVDTMKLVKK